MLIVALVLAVVGLAALVTAVVTSNELVAWVCIAASVIGVLLLIVDALRERQRRDTGESADSEAASHHDAPQAAADEDFDADYPDEQPRQAVPDAPGDDTVSTGQGVPDSTERIERVDQTGDEAAGDDRSR